MALLLRAYTTPANTTATPPGAPAVAVSAPFPLWPRINDNVVDGTPVSYLWNVDPLTQPDVDAGQVVTFTTTLALPTLIAAVAATVVVAVFADNGSTTSLALNGVPVSFSVVNPLVNGGPVVTFGEDNAPPYFWDNVVVGVAEVTLAVGANTLTLTTTVANYATPGIPAISNPAGYLAEVRVYAPIAV
ncbi:MAG: hypothetical protein IMX02_13255 [Limnochordaceae bacterium]|uniref:Uncharacterized protein n=1 Tax=Carboxydichorda subterranea TaxID=3109565 RepID=A0ABZ1BX54_9FIRM|nr:hypothetical protein [Limnochorda sp. L945t]MBE3599696.1 hypothetical protein [Limnochordaceae bacterium]WRP17178.1 hypothetical protein U7230_14010 [Limnochorda sp. L945t]